MRLRDFGTDKPREWFQQILQWSQGKIGIENLDTRTVIANIATTETRVPHSLGRIPQFVIPVMIYPYGTTEISFTKEPTFDTLYLKGATAGVRALLVL